MVRARPAVLALVIATGLVALEALLLPVVVGPAADPEPHGLPIAVAGPSAAAAALAARLEVLRPGGFDMLLVPGGSSADAGIRDRSVLGAVVQEPDGVAVHVTSAGSPASAALLTRTVAALGPATVVDVVPADPDDPRGTGLAAATLLLTTGALLAGGLMVRFVRGRAARVAGVLALGVLTGLAGAVVLRWWLGVLPGDVGSDAAAIGLFVTAVAAMVTGLGALLGRAGVVLGVLLILLGQALSAAPELLPQPWRAAGMYLPPGAGTTLLRSVAWFGGSGATPEAMLLIACTAAGLLLTGTRGTMPTGSPRASGAGLPEPAT